MQELRRALPWFCSVTSTRVIVVVVVVLFLPEIKENYQALELHFPELVDTESSAD